MHYELLYSNDKHLGVGRFLLRKLDGTRIFLTHDDSWGAVANLRAVIQSLGYGKSVAEEATRLAAATGRHEI